MKNILNEELSYDKIIENTVLFRHEDAGSYESEKYNEFSPKDNLYTEEDNENKLKDCVYNLLNELKSVIELNFIDKDICIECSYNINDYDETIASISVLNNIIELKLNNDYMYQCDKEINSIYMTLYLNGKGICTECIQIIKEEYEFTGVKYVPINEVELYFKGINKENLINEIVKIIKDITNK